MKTTIDSAGRIVVPKAVRDQLHLTPGSELEIDALGDAVVICHRDNNLQQRGYGHDKYHTSGCDSRTDQDI
jgi:AbrB family looped-hinge helix DNA binding protein